MKRIRLGNPQGHRVLSMTLAIILIAAIVHPLSAATQTSAGTLDRIKQSGKITIGYRTDVSPFSFNDKSGNPAGFTVMLCQKIVEQIKTELKLTTLAVKWVPVTEENRFRELQQGRVDMLCGADTDTLSRRKLVSFSIPIYPGGIGAVVRMDAAQRLREILINGQAVSRPLWRGSPAHLLDQQTFSVIAASTSEKWLRAGLNKFQLSAKVVPVASYDEGLKRVLDRSSNVFFGERAVLLDMVKRSSSANDLLVLDRHFTIDLIAIALTRGDEDFRLLVDMTLSRFYKSLDFRPLYAKWFGDPSEYTLIFFGLSALPE